MTKKISLTILGIAILFILSFIIFLFVANPGANLPKSGMISINGEDKDIRKIGISFPLSKDSALKIAKTFCNINLQKTFKGDIYNQIKDLNDKWFVYLNITDCNCGVIVDKKTGETTCYKSFSPEELK